MHRNVLKIKLPKHAGQVLKISFSKTAGNRAERLETSDKA